MEDIAYVERTSRAHASEFFTNGISSIAALLERGGPAKGRHQIAATNGIESNAVPRSVSHQGRAGEYSGLLEAAGVDTVGELARRRADDLHRA